MLSDIRMGITMGIRMVFRMVFRVSIMIYVLCHFVIVFSELLSLIFAIVEGANNMVCAEGTQDCADNVCSDSNDRDHEVILFSFLFFRFRFGGLRVHDLCDRLEDIGNRVRLARLLGDIVNFLRL